MVAMGISRGMREHGSGALIVLSLVGLSFTAGGCSWLFTQALPEQYSRYEIPPCSTNRAPPVLDTIFTLTNISSAIYVANQPNVINKENAVGLGLSVATLWALSAVYGYRHTSECEDAHAGRAPGFTPARRAPPAGMRYYPPPTQPPAAYPAAAPPAVLPAQPPAPYTSPAPPAPPAPQQQDDDDPAGRRRQ